MTELRDRKIQFNQGVKPQRSLMKFPENVGMVVVFCVAAAVASQAQTFTTLFTFDGSNGAKPQALIQGTDGNLYGATYSGGKNGEHNSLPGDGTVFGFATDGALTAFHNFCTQLRCADGLYPSAALLQAPNQIFYGTTQMGGSGANCGSRPNYGCGTVFKVTPNGTETPIYSFCSQTGCADGNSPEEPLALGPNGNLYGVTFGGGSGGGCGHAVGCGTVFEITPAGALTTLHSFCATIDSCPDGAAPQAPVVVGTNGNIYGAANGILNSGGTFFAITPAKKFSALHAFNGATDGIAPTGLIQGSDGNFYGTAAFGGSGAHCTSGELCGTIFKVTPQGQFTTLYNFCSQLKCADGSGPYSGLIQGSDGNLYGITIEGGTNYNQAICNGSCGTLFQVTLQGQLTTLYNFCAQANCADGWGSGTIMQATNGTFYGTTGLGGSSSGTCAGGGCGTIFSLSMGLGPFVEANPGFGKIGYKINVLGNNLTGTTSVTFGGVAASFTVVSDALVEATVPSGAASGTIQVTTPSGALNSNLAFQVVP